MIISKNNAIRVEKFSLFMAEYFCAISRYFCNENIHNICPLQYSWMYSSYCNIVFWDDYFVVVFISAAYTRLQKANSQGLYILWICKSQKKIQISYFFRVTQLPWLSGGSTHNFVITKSLRWNGCFTVTLAPVGNIVLCFWRLTLNRPIQFHINSTSVIRTVKRN